MLAREYSRGSPYPSVTHKRVSKGLKLMRLDAITSDDDAREVLQIKELSKATNCTGMAGLSFWDATASNFRGSDSIV